MSTTTKANERPPNATGVDEFADTGLMLSGRPATPSLKRGTGGRVTCGGDSCGGCGSESDDWVLLVGACAHMYVSVSPLCALSVFVFVCVFVFACVFVCVCVCACACVRVHVRARARARARRGV
jgi:hypothetical protein